MTVCVYELKFNYGAERVKVYMVFPESVAKSTEHSYSSVIAKQVHKALGYIIQNSEPKLPGRKMFDPL